ncbi:MAG: ABC transporter permease, partial [Verrucomicrobiota bacterium]
MSDAATIAEAPPRQAKFWGTVRQQPQLWAGVFMLGTIALLALLAPLIAPFAPDEINLDRRLMSPGWPHLFGTDELGRDVFSRVLYGARISLLVGITVVGSALLIGIPIGLIAGYLGGRTDIILMRVADIFLAFPPLLLPLAITAALGPDLTTAMLALSISWFPWYARIIRSSVIATKQELYVSAARAAGTHKLTIMFRHILPNSLTG